ncbi:hypothetical protein [Selenomonas sp.]|uniref:hypothetical protein n=1 Tax=Selenomonas sp. TaxID=2053611 RepID=UPI003FA2F486
MLTRICPSCGRLVQQGEACPCQAKRHKAYDRERRDKDRARFYHSREWRAVAAAVRARAGYADELAKAGGRLVPGAVVHHIHPVGDRPDLRLSMANLIYVSTRTHKEIHDAYNKNPQAKKEMQERLLAALALNPSIGGRGEKV